MELNLRFGGFYYSVHSEIVDSIVESHIEDNDETTNKEEFYDSIDYQKTYLDYCKLYIKYFFDYIEEVEGVVGRPPSRKLTIKSKNIELWSPREYNFSTDLIVLKEVSKSSIKNLTTLFNRYLDDKEFREFIKDKTTSRSGYIPFYNYGEIIDKKDLGISLEFILEFLANDFKDEGDLYHKMTENLNLSINK